MTRTRALLPILTAAALAACGASGIHNPVLADMERMRTSPALTDAGRLAPQKLAEAESERALALKAANDGDETSAALYASQAIASYTGMLVLGRLARATTLADQARSDLAREEARGQKLAAERAQAERLADDLDKKLKIAQETLSPAPVGRADPEREAARLVAARALATEARLLCGAARLVSASVEGLADLDKQVDALDAELEKTPRPSPIPIDTAARVRAGCLSALTRARRTSEASPATDPDALLAELSAAGAFAPSRDERGVVIVFEEPFKGSTLNPAAAKGLSELGRVAAAHPGVPVQVVVHDAVTPSAAEAAADLARSQSAAQALVAAGAPQGKVKAEAVGARAPLVDPADAKHRGRNARLEVVFVSGLAPSRE